MSSFKTAVRRLEYDFTVGQRAHCTDIIAAPASRAKIAQALQKKHPCFNTVYEAPEAANTTEAGEHLFRNKTHLVICIGVLEF